MSVTDINRIELSKDKKQLLIVRGDLTMQEVQELAKAIGEFMTSSEQVLVIFDDKHDLEFELVQVGEDGHEDRNAVSA